MKPHVQTSPTPVIDRGQLAIHLLCALTAHQRKGTRCTLDELVAELGVRRPDVRSVVSALHREGYLDLQRMRVTLAGFAIGDALGDQPLAAVRRARRARGAPRSAAA